MKIKIAIITQILAASFASANIVDLKNIIDNAYLSNNSLQAYEYKKQSKKLEVDATKRGYLPTVDIGANYQYNSPKSTFTAGRIASAYATASVDIFDWGKKNSLVNAKKYEYKASSLEKEAFAKSMELDIIQSYFTAQKISANIDVLKSKQKELAYQKTRINAFVNAGLATVDDRDKLQASFDENSYEITSAQILLDEQYEHIKLISGVEFGSLAGSSIKNPTSMKPDTYEKPKIIQAQKDALIENIDALDAAVMPQVKLQDTYTMSHFSDKPTGAFDSMFLSEKNTLMLVASMPLFDGGVASKEREALKVQGMALNEEIIGSQKEQVSLYRVAKDKLFALTSKIGSAKSALKSATSTYNAIKNKFNAGLVDNVSYLDALNNKSIAQSRLKESQYDYEIAKSSFYYFAGKNPREYIK